MRLTSTFRASSDPTRCTSPFSTARSSFACSPSGSSPISSRNSAPRSACSSIPGLVYVAQSIEIERLGQIIERPELDRFDRGVDAGITGHERHLTLRRDRSNLPEDVETTHVRQAQIDQRDVWLHLAQRGQGITAAVMLC